VPGSVRRTSSIDVFWPEGRTGNLRFAGRARDIMTPPAGGAPIICAEDSFEARLALDRSITAIAADPPRPGLKNLIGQRGGGGLREALQAALPEERRQGTPLYLILDDIAGVSLVSGWAWSQWDPDWLAHMRALLSDGAWAKRLASREGVCIGFAPGSSGLDVDRPVARGDGTPAPDLRNPEDPAGWHDFPAVDGMNMRRARRIDVIEDDIIRIDSAFQDSASTPQGCRAVVHEYRLAVTADSATLRVTSMTTDPRVLPFVECPSAAKNLDRLIGVKLADLRDIVLAELRGVAGCTHLNDALRALAETPVLLDYLRRAEALPLHSAGG
jgi:hypothetical protein